MRKKLFSGLKKTVASVLSAVMVLSTFSGLTIIGTRQEVVYASNNSYELVDDIQDSAILHCWNWSYSTIEDHLDLIAQCGYSAIQTSPAQQPKDYSWEGVVGMDVGFPSCGGTGNWWKLYQPVTFSVCDNGITWLGTKAELESLCAKAETYGIKVIVDVVANHMGNITGWKNNLSDVSKQVGEYWNPDMLTDETFWHINTRFVHDDDSRLSFTMGCMGMPDLNTADSRVQTYVKNYLNELIDCGVDGFRFDAAKHIETPDDDPAYASDFWPNVLNSAKSYYKSKTGKDLYVYGEILNTVGDNFDISSYTKYMSVTDNNAGNKTLEGVRGNTPSTPALKYPANKSVLWAESHDTYMNESSRYASDRAIIRTWAAVGNVDNAAALFYVRPYYSTETLVNDMDNQFISNPQKNLEKRLMGVCNTYTWASKEVAAINHFNNRFHNSSDSQGTDGNITYIKRGNGIILVNFNGAGKISTNAHGLASGTYTDEVSGNTFTVSGGTISGNITSEYGVAVIYQNVMSNPTTNRPAQIATNLGNGSVFYTNGLDVDVTVMNATSASYSATTGESGTLTGTKTITIGKGLKDGQTVTLTVKATSSYGTVTKKFTYTKQTKAIEISTSKKDGSGFYTDGFTLTMEALYATKATYTTSDGQSGSFTTTKDITIGTGLKVGEKVTVTIKATNDLGSVTKTFTYVKKEGSNAIYFKNTGNWSTVTAYAWKNETVKNAAWPGAPMECIDAENQIYMVELDPDAGYTKIIFSNNGASQTANLDIPELGYIYTGSGWEEYQPVGNKPVISAELDSCTLTGAKNVKFTVKNATSATYSLNGAKDVSFTDSVTLTVGKNQTDTVVITATNSDGTTSKTFTYQLQTSDTGYIYFKNTSNWATPYAYMWNEGSNKNAAWPGEKMILVDAEKGIWKCEVKESYDMVIFNNGSGGSGNQTADLTNKGAGYMYVLSTDSWEKFEELKTGWQQVGDSWYYYDNTGTMVKGWRKISGKWYYFNTSGIMQTGWVKVSGKWYHLKASGAMQTGWQKISGKWYYLNSSGAMQTSWVKINGKWYYLNGSGIMQTSWIKINGKWYYLNGSGIMQTGWIKLNGRWYYLLSSGEMVSGKTVTISGKKYTFNSNGVWIN